MTNYDWKTFAAKKIQAEKANKKRLGFFKHFLARFKNEKYGKVLDK
jgi:hypothetical protein